MTAGYVAVPRLEADLLGDEQEITQSHRGAWFWLFDRAAWKDRLDQFGRFTVELRRGEIACSYRYLARAWNWSHGRVQRWLNRLAARGKISIRSEAGVVVIGLTGYRAEPATESQKPRQTAVRAPVDDQQPSQRRIQEQPTELEKKEGDALGRCAPVTDADREYVSQQVETLKQSLTGRRPPRISDHVAYEAAVKADKRKIWLHALGAWVGQKFDGAARMQAWEMLAEAERAGSRAATPKHVTKIIDRLDKLYREDIERITAAADRARERARRESIGAVDAENR